MKIIGHVSFPSCLLVLLVVFFSIPAHLLAEIPASTESVNTTNSPGVPVEITADRIEYDQEREEYHAIGDVDVIRGSVRLTADEATLQKLTGLLTAVGHVHLRDENTDVWAEQLELNVNTEAGVLTTGRIFEQKQNSYVTGRHFQRFSETRYRIKDGSFTTCDAKDGEIPAWRFTFDDVDLDYEDSLWGKGVWFNINDVPVVPIPTFGYPLGASRKTGFLIPNVGINSKFGFTYEQGFFWAINPSHDLTISPRILTKRGPGGDLEYRYAWNRKTKGNWLVKSIYDTDENRGRAEIRGAHIQEFSQDLSLRILANYSTDRTVLQNFSNSGAQRALPSQESIINILQRLDHGALYLFGQYLQPLGDGGDTTFQRLPELGHQFFNPSVLGSPFSLTSETTFVNFSRKDGFDVSRIDLLPGMSVEGLNLGNVAGFRPQVKFREVAYTRGQTEKSLQHRETFWVAAEGFTNLSRRFSFGDDSWVRHSIKPHVMYEFVPPTDQSEFVQVDAVDDLIKKSLVTYSLKNRISQQGGSEESSTWLDVLFAQSYHVGTPPPLASPFSDIWTRGEFHKPLGSPSFLSEFNFRLDTFINPYKQEFREVNTDAFIQGDQDWYVSVGQRYTRAGPRVRRGDIWNPLSFNEMLEPDEKILFLTAGGAVRLPLGLTLGTRWYHDLRTGQTAEWDVMGLYQNPCRCFSFGLYYQEFPDRTQFDFLISLTGLWGTQSNGSALMQSILGPIMKDEKGVPWDYR